MNEFKDKQGKKTPKSGVRSSERCKESESIEDIAPRSGSQKSDREIESDPTVTDVRSEMHRSCEIPPGLSNKE